jgi:hypothetical protein
MVLPTLITLTRDLQTTDPKDRLYGLLGINEGNDIQVSVKPHITISNLYRDFAIE